MSYRVNVRMKDGRTTSLPERFASSKEAVWHGVKEFAERLEIVSVWVGESRDPVTHKFRMPERTLERTA